MLNPRLIQYAIKGLAAVGAAIFGTKAGSGLSDQKEQDRRRKLLEEERLRHERLTRSRNHKPESE